MIAERERKDEYENSILYTLTVSITCIVLSRHLGTANFEDESAFDANSINSFGSWLASAVFSLESFWSFG